MPTLIIPHTTTSAVLLACALATAACATPTPQDPVQRALYRDLRQIVQTRERTGWLIDRAELDAVTPTALQSACQVVPEHRRTLLEWLQHRIEELGGDPEAAWNAGERDLDHLEERITLTRIRTLLERAHTAAVDDCPFWLEADPHFDGVQASSHRFIIIAESIGGFLLAVRADGSVAIGGGGGGRLLPAYGVAEDLTLALGLEIAGIGSFTNDTDRDDSGVGESLSATIMGAVPLLVRFHSGGWLFDLELAAVSRWHEGDLTLPGARLAFGAGLGAVRVAGAMPQGLGWIGYEFLPADAGLPESHLFRVGTRVGIDYDP